MTEAILSLALLILLAKVLEEVATRLRQPPLLGDVLAGLLLGPLVFRVVEPGREIELFITVGIFFFFFLVGLEEIDLAGFPATLLDAALRWALQRVIEQATESHDAER